MGASCQKIFQIKTKQRRDQLNHKFQKWKMHYFACKHGLEPVVQTRTHHVEYSMSQSELSSGNNDALRIMMSAIIRYKSRRLCKSFWVWH